MGTPARPRAGAVPAIGEQVTYTLDPGYFAQREFPPSSQTPWTHGGPPQQAAGEEPAGEAARMTEPRPFDPAAETDRVIAAVLASMTAPASAASSSTRRPAPGKAPWSSRPPPTWRLAARPASSSRRPTTRSMT